MCKIIYFQSDVGIQFKWRGRVDTFEKTSYASSCQMYNIMWTMILTSGVRVFTRILKIWCTVTICKLEVMLLSLVDIHDKPRGASLKEEHKSFKVKIQI
jgi:hypothetical protein